MKTISKWVPWLAGLAMVSALAQDPAPPAGGGEGRPRREGREGGGREGGGREGGGREGGMRGGPGMMSPVVQALDTDGDGELSAAEIANASASLKKLDKNGDGKIDREEMRPAFGPGQRRGPGGGSDTAERLTQLMSYDKNGDGKLVAAELPERMQAMIERADADKDGSVTRAELEAFLNRQGAGRGPGGGGPGGQGGPGGGEGGGRRRPGAE